MAAWMIMADVRYSQVEPWQQGAELSIVNLYIFLASLGMSSFE